jgi:hypothetical protein
MMGAPATRRIVRTARPVAWRWLTLLRSVLSEIFDESAYARFLDRRGIESSRQAYADFLQEAQAAGERRPRCC